MVSERGTVWVIPPSGPGGPSSAIDISSNSDDDDELPIASRVTRLRNCKMILPDVEEEPSAEAEPVATAESVARVESAGENKVADMERDHDAPFVESEQVSLMWEL